MQKISVLFPYVEAGYGHIMPLRALEETFKEKYGAEFTILSSEFFNETNDKHLMRYEKMMTRYVRLCNRFPLFGFVSTQVDYIIGPALSSLFVIRLFAPIACRRGIRYMQTLSPDVVFSTHWATNYYAEHLKNKPLTVLYCPDAELNGLFSYRSDLTLVNNPEGCQKALGKRRFTDGNLREVPFLLRSDALRAETDKKKARRKLGLPEEKFTVLIAEGGYGIGKIEALCKRLVKAEYPLTLVAACGKNERLLERLQTLEPSRFVTFVPCGFLENILDYHAASDLFCGKSGTMPAEATFFGNPTVVTACATVIEARIARHYRKHVGSAIRKHSAGKTAALIARFAADPNLMEPYRKAALSYHAHFGSEQAADLLYKTICERFGEER